MFYQFHEPADEQGRLCAPSITYPCYRLFDLELEQVYRPNQGMPHEQLLEHRVHLLWLREGTLLDNHLTMLD